MSRIKLPIDYPSPLCYNYRMISDDTLARLNKSYVAGETKMGANEVTALKKHEEKGHVKISWTGDPARPHCVDGPAVVWLDYTGLKLWLVHGQLHREDGPAMVAVNQEGFWWICGELIQSYEELQQATNCSPEELAMLKLRWGKMRDINI